MSYQNTVLALLAIIIVAIASHEMRAEIRGDEARDGACEPAALDPLVRVARVEKGTLADSLRDPVRLAQLLGLTDPVPRSDRRSLARVAFGDASHAVVDVRDGKDRVKLVVLAE